MHELGEGRGHAVQGMQGIFLYSVARSATLHYKVTSRPFPASPFPSPACPCLAFAKRMCNCIDAYKDTSGLSCADPLLCCWSATQHFDITALCVRHCAGSGHSCAGSYPGRLAQDRWQHC